MIRVVLVEPQYPVNIGSVCRVMSNFGLKELYMVAPKTDISEEAFMYAKHAQPILEKAKIVKKLENAISDCDLVIGTTGITQRFNYSLKKCLIPRDLPSSISKYDKIALLFGNEGNGLTLKQINACDMLVSIPTDKKYPVLNLSHAVAVMLYELFNSKKVFTHYKFAKRKNLKFLIGMFSQIIDSLPEIRDKKKVQKSFQNLIGRARLSEEELQALFVAIGGIRKRLVGKK